MPKRSNEKPQIIEALKALTAPHGSKVTASKMLTKHGSAKEREVDVVIETRVDDDIFVQSVEIVARGRPATVEWIEQMICKHRKMPTDRLCLVSWSGFTADCFDDVQSEPWVVLVKPEPTGGRVSLISEELLLTPGWMVFTLSNDDGSTFDREFSAEEAKGVTIWSNAGNPQGTAWELGNLICHQPLVGQPALEVASKAPVGDGKFWGDLTSPAAALGVGIRIQDSGTPLPVSKIRMAIGMQFRRQNLSLEIRTFRERRFAYTTNDLAGQATLLVAELDEGEAVTKMRVEPSKSAQKKG